ncbi:hypothetical protein BJM39_29265 [Salmonella enterica subsp. enterica serovar Javiana]|nr:hypothetical protein BJM39_29265 [Salmonella enterica subsp. enterica serovar Javiana]
MRPGSDPRAGAWVGIADRWSHMRHSEAGGVKAASMWRVQLAGGWAGAPSGYECVLNVTPLTLPEVQPAQIVTSPVEAPDLGPDRRHTG